MAVPLVIQADGLECIGGRFVYLAETAAAVQRYFRAAEAVV